jgi:putative hydrolase of the HAD superfamily
MRFADVDAVTIDAFGTLVRLRDPIGPLTRLTGRDPESVRKAFEAEMTFYRERTVEGGDPARLADLRQRCAAVFSENLGSAVSADQFVGALHYEPLEGVAETLASLRGRGLELAVVANWDCALAEHLERLGLAQYFSAVVTSAQAGAAKPDPAIFRTALDRLGVAASRAVHVGDDRVDEVGATAAGLAFLSAPLPHALAAFA